MRHFRNSKLAKTLYYLLTTVVTLCGMFAIIVLVLKGNHDQALIVGMLNIIVNLVLGLLKNENRRK